MQTVRNLVKPYPVCIVYMVYTVLLKKNNAHAYHILYDKRTKNNI